MINVKRDLIGMSSCHLVTLSVIVHLAVASANCPTDEYRLGGECCPLCPAGKRVEKDCTAHSITKCTSCTEGTFNGHLTREKKCSPCMQCKAGLGLKVKKSCTLTSDALCEPLDGYLCADSNRGGCMAAQRHTVCSPGQYINQTGTADKDTECLQCAEGTFSDGSSTFCQNHKKCESVGMTQIKPGTDSTDSEWGEHGQSPDMPTPDTWLWKALLKGTVLITIFILLFIGFFLGRLQ